MQNTFLKDVRALRWRLREAEEHIARLEDTFKSLADAITEADCFGAWLPSKCEQQRKFDFWEHDPCEVELGLRM